MVCFIGCLGFGGGQLMAIWVGFLWTIFFLLWFDI